MIVLILSILGSVFSLGGNILIARKKRSGWLWWIGGNVAWIAVNFLGQMNVPMVLMYVAYFIINVTGYREWRKEADVIKEMNKGEQIMKTDKIIYPLVVVNDRYMGTYSGGEWVALNCYPEDVPEAIFGDDLECFDFWMRWNERKGRSVIPIAVGNTCEEAIEKLREFIAQH